jgi:hypothetical protein
MSNYLTVQGPDYGAYAQIQANFGQRLGQMLGQLPDQFMKGRENARTIAKQDAFKDGMPVQKDANGNPIHCPDAVNQFVMKYFHVHPEQLN